MSDDNGSVTGVVVDDSDPVLLSEAIEQAFGYRGDVTVVCRSRTEPIVGYLYDRVVRPTLAESKLRIMPADGSPRLTIAYDDVAEVRFSGRDTAAGRSFDSWMKKYVKKKLAGERADIESESLDEG